MVMTDRLTGWHRPCHSGDQGRGQGSFYHCQYSVSPLPPPLSLFVFVSSSSTSFFRTLHPPLLFCFKNLKKSFFFYTRCKHSQRLISDLVESPCRRDTWTPVTDSTSMASTDCCEFKPFISVATALFFFCPQQNQT